MVMNADTDSYPRSPETSFTVAPAAKASDCDD
jgi:hypothetical protein